MVRCAHFGETIAYLYSSERFRARVSSHCRAQNLDDGAGFAVVVGTIGFFICPNCGEKLFNVRHQAAAFPSPWMDNEADALAAFYAAEAKLLGREPFLHEHPLYGAAVRHALGIDEVGS